VRVLEGRLSKIIIVEFVFATVNVFKLVLYKNGSLPTKKLASEMVYSNEIPQYVLNTETFGSGDGGLIKILVHDLRNDTKEEIVIKKRDQGDYTLLKNLN
jgi:hypothetical protein